MSQSSGVLVVVVMWPQPWCELQGIEARGPTLIVLVCVSHESILVASLGGLRRVVFYQASRVGVIPISYLGLPLGAPHNSLAAWDEVEEGFVRLRLEQIQQNFLWGGGTLERKPHLVKFTRNLNDWEIEIVEHFLARFLFKVVVERGEDKQGKGVVAISVLSWVIHSAIKEIVSEIEDLLRMWSSLIID
ncbi:hypothetical protein CK203_052723 [Vitis vinifera]|uniref:Uncharacterized protein n=1 Tax=Vitis vinifera TaxID=29760 RepID=A0A438GCP8_VITVI|nr:hypothetical protein CK203_052723 [Vitis vinifera]